MRGWVYVITNKSMPEIVKVGHSTQDPKILAQELDHIGTPHPYVIYYDVLVENPKDIKQKVHSKLNHTNEGKEWFRCLPEVAIATIRDVVGNAALLENLREMHSQKMGEMRMQKEAEENRRETERIEAIRRKERADNERMEKEKIKVKKQILAKYDELLQQELPDIHFIEYFLFILIIQFVLFYSLIPDGKTTDFFIIVTVITAGVCGWLLKYFHKKLATRRDKYILLVLQRKRELSDLEKKYPYNLSSLDIIK